MSAIPDYKSFLKDCYKKFPAIASVHVFHFTQDGIQSMASNSHDENWRSDNSVEPFKMIIKTPFGQLPSLVHPAQISKERLSAIAKAKKPANSEVFFPFHFH